MGANLQFESHGQKIGHPQHGFGYQPDPGVHGANGIYTGFQHHVASKMAASALPAMTNNEAKACAVWNQGQTSGCTGHGKAGMDTTTLAAHGKPLPSPELPRWEYLIGRAVDRTNPDTPLQDQGAQPNSLCRASAIWGVVLDGEDDGGRTATSPDYTSFLEAHIDDEPKLGELETAGKRLITGYNAIADTDPNKLLQFQQAMATGHAVGIAVDAGSNAFQGYDESKGPLDYTGSDPDHWIHALDYGTVAALIAAGRIPSAWASLGLTTILWLIQNSWGVGLWTRTGRAWVTSAFIGQGAFNSIVASLGV